MSSSATAASTVSYTTEGPPQQPQQPLIPGLSDDVALNCLARVPRSHYATLSLVSRTIGSLLSSPLLYDTRFLLGCTESLLYVSLRFPTTPSTRWFTLHQGTRRTLVPIPPIPLPSLVSSDVVLVGPEIYVIGGSVNNVPSSRVWVFDCRFHSWRQAPSMSVGREFPAAGPEFAATAVLDGRIYVIGGCVADKGAQPTNWTDSFDTKTQSWLGRCDAPKKRLDLGWRGRECVIDDVLYICDYLGKIGGYDPQERVWRELQGVEGLPKFPCGATTITNFGGRMAVLWEGKAGSGGGKGKKMEIWCAEINLERREGGEICGRVLWSDVVRRVPNASSIVHCLAVTL